MAAKRAWRSNMAHQFPTAAPCNLAASEMAARQSSSSPRSQISSPSRSTTTASSPPTAQARATAKPQSLPPATIAFPQRRICSAHPPASPRKSSSHSRRGSTPTWTRSRLQSRTSLPSASPPSSPTTPSSTPHTQASKARTPSPTPSPIPHSPEPSATSPFATRFPHSKENTSPT